MFRRFSTNFAVFSIFMDAALIAFALTVADGLRWYFNFLPFVQTLPKSIHVPKILHLVFAVIWVSVFLLFSVYDGRRNLRFADELISFSLGSFLASISMAGVLYLSYRDVSRFLFLTFILLAYLMLLSWRILIRTTYGWARLRGSQTQNVMILGAGKSGEQLREQVLKNAHLGLRFVGFLDDDRRKVDAREDVLASINLAREICQQCGVDDVVVALPSSAHTRLNLVVSEMHDLPVRVWVIPDYFSLTVHKASVLEFAGIPMLDLRAPTLTEYQRMVKRAFDLVVSILILPFALLMMGIVAVLIKLGSSGPVLIRQKRVGENGRLFEMYKFRTMVEGAEQLLHLVERTDEEGRHYYKTPDDPRVTPVGRIFRRTSLDELPQLFNVLKGEMGLVGPRPEMPEKVKEYEPWQRKRFTVPQGITGWWQVSGRSDKPMHLHTEDDLYYVQNYSIWLDLQILVRTIWVVAKGKGAY